jgi:aspartate/methionine/tyrosine aminotransferase
VLPIIEYLEFAGRYYAAVRYDLATSGLRPIAAAELGSVAHDDYGARQRFAAAVGERYGTPKDEVVPCLGTAGALFTAYAALLGPGDQLVVERPSYEPLWRVAAGQGVHIDFFERRREDGYAIVVEDMLSRLTPSTRMVAVTNPHNPSGVLEPASRLDELAAALASRGVWLLVDEAYLELAAPGTTARVLRDNIVTCSSITKCWGVPWARAGWLLLPAIEAQKARHVERHICGLAPPGSWAFGELAFEKCHELAERAERLQKSKRDLVEAFVARHADEIDWQSPHPKSLYGYLRDRAERNLTELVERGVAREGVLVAPGAFFGDASCFRLSWTTDLDSLERGLVLLARVLELRSEP